MCTSGRIYDIIIPRPSTVVISYFADIVETDGVLLCRQVPNRPNVEKKKKKNLFNVLFREDLFS